MAGQDLALLLTPTGRALLDRLGREGVGDELRTATRLRREGQPPELVAAAIEQVRLRERARSRFGPQAARMWWTPAGLEQASRPEVAARRAARFEALGGRRLADLGCGVGGDLLALAAAVPHVLAVDRDPQAVLAARANVEELGLANGVEVRCGDVREVGLAGLDAAFVDPARRSTAGRIFRPEDYQPAFSFVAELAARVPASAAKLAPGLPHALVPEGVEAEWVSVAGEVKEVCLWHGPLASTGVTRRATLLPSAVTITDRELAPVGTGSLGRWLVEPDGAVIRAGLVAAVAAQVDGRLLDPAIAYVITDEEPVTPYGRTYEVLEELPFARKRLRSALRERGYGDVVVKKRGLNVVPEELRRALRLGGDGPTATLVLTRTATGPLALLVTLTLPIPPPPRSPCSSP